MSGGESGLQQHEEQHEQQQHEQQQQQPPPMLLALQEGEAALSRREVPVGCVFLLPAEHSPTGRAEIVGRGGNETNELGNATRHAEIVALDGMYRKLQHEPCGVYSHFSSLTDLASKCELYVTCEPCIMCAGALSKVRVGKIFFGCHNDKFGGCGSVINVDPSLSIETGIMAEEAVALFKRFYDRENPQSKAKLLEEVAEPCEPA